MILHIENPKDAPGTLLELTSQSGKAAGQKINIQKSIAFLYTNSKISETEKFFKIPFNCIKKY